MAMTQQDVIKKFMAALDKTTLTGSKALDEAIRACSSFKSAQEVIDKMLADQKAAGSGDKFLKDYCGINLDNTDTGAITGSDAGGKTTKTASSVVPENTKVKLDTTFKGTSFTVTKYGVTFNLNGSFDALNDDAKYAWRAMKTWWAEAALDLVKESYGYSYSDGNDKNLEKNILINFIDDPFDGNTMATYYSTVNVNGVTMRKIEINMAQWNNLQHDMDGTNSSSDSYTAYMDRDFSHELTHALMFGKIKEFVKIPSTIREGVAELTHGRDDKKTKDIETLAGSAALMSKVFNGSSFFATVSSGVAKVVESPAYVAGYIFMRYLAKQASETGDWTGTSGKDTYTNKVSGVKLSALAGNDYVYSTGASVSIDGGAGADTLINGDDGTELANFVTIIGGDGNDRISNWDNNVTIYGGAGNDTIFNAEDNSTGVVIFGDAGNDSIRTWGDRVTITGGAGNDAIRNYVSSSQNLYKYSSGDGVDTIEGMTTGDTLSLSGSSNFSTVVSGNNLVVKNGSTNAVTIKDGKGKNLKIVGLTAPTISSVTKNYTASAKVNGTAANDTIENYAAKASVYGAAGNDSLYNSSVGSNAVLDGGAGNDSIYNRGKNVTLLGGAGKDSITSEGANSTIQGGADNDSIYVYATSHRADGDAGDDYLYASSLAGSSVLDGGDGKDYLYNRGKNVTLLGGTGNDTLKSEATVFIKDDSGDNYIYIWEDATNSTIQAGTGKDVIKTEADHTTIKAGKGNDSIYLWGSNNLLDYTSGDGSDTVYYATSSDTLQISGGSFTTTTSGNDFIVKVGSGSVTFKDAKNQKPKIAAKSVAPAGISVKGAVLTATTAFTDTKIDLADYASTVTKVNASALSRSVYIFGSSASNSLKGGKGADVIFGGAGNDTVSLGGGKDVYVYSGGNDLIQDYAAGQDEIYLDRATITGSSLSGSNVVLKTSAGNLTIKNGKNKNITVLDSAGTKTTKKYSNSGSSALWFAEDDTNFISSSANLDDISAEKFSVTNVATSSGVENIFAQNSSSVTAIAASTNASTYAKI